MENRPGCTKRAFRSAFFPAFLVVTVSAVWAGCLLIDGTDSGHGLSVRFRATQDAYEPVVITGVAVLLHFDIATRLENTGQEKVTLIGCLRPSLPQLQRFDGEAWTPVYSAIELLCLGPPLILKPGEVFADTLEVSTVLDPNVVPEAKWESGEPVEGTYRLERAIYRWVPDDSGGGLLPLADRVSQTFEIHPRYVPSN